MHTWIALLRAVNVGGTGKLAMSDLVALCERAGFTGARTYIQSGNVVFRADAPRDEVQLTLERGLEALVGKPVAVLLRRPADLDAILATNPFPDAPGNRVIVTFLPHAPDATAIPANTGPGGEELVLCGSELLIRYPEGQGRSKLEVPFADVGTGRNLNTVARLAAMAKALDAGEG